ncbi:glycoside hydrolase family 65 protein [Lactiplantibacillus plajomi]|uniref:Glycoside hydrolase family 65 protein n=1 Tax=Lactiplantibacillus plajomi TaxID=1457217 RepID=A0ABV6K261_9LACO|nr:glycosyl hydrolase family 65 protein [Lactiplantibacillus plajomi]
MQSTKLTLDDVANKDRQYLETIFALGDGHFGVRDAVPFTGNQAGTLPVMLVNGLYVTNPIVYGENAYGYAKLHQTIVSLPNPRNFDLISDTADSTVPGDWRVDLKRTALDFSDGSLNERFGLETKAGEKFLLTVNSWVVQDGTHQFTVTYTLKSINYTGTIQFKRSLFVNGGERSALINDDDPRVAARNARLAIHIQNTKDERSFQWTSKTESTSQTLIQEDQVNAGPQNYSLIRNESGFEGAGKIAAGEEVTWQFTRRLSEINGELKPQQKRDDQAVNRQILGDFWNQSRVELSDEQLQKGIQYNLFQLFQSAGRDGRSNIAAKGITGPGYEGHYFWDTEMYILPFFIYTNPEIAKRLLSYRYSILQQARNRARDLGVDSGALFAWRTINGEEASAYFPAGTAQYHINADIAHAIKLYYEVTDDGDFLRQKGAEIVLETARFWLAYGSWRERKGQQEFCLYKVTGPDEYTALIDNNYYTNRMAKENLAFAVWLIKHGYMVADPGEQEQFSAASERMYLPYDEEQRVTKQDDESPEMPVWPFAKTPKTNYPLLLHYHPLMIYRHRVNKQADTLLAEMIFPEDQSNQQLRRDYDYYEPITTHDSSLSRSIFSILASRLRRPQKAFKYYMDTSLMDLVDLQGNASDGLHEANLGGSWLGLTYGFAGMYVKHGRLHITNYLPDELDHLAFRIRFRGSTLEIKLQRTQTNVLRVAGPTLEVVVDGKARKIK